MNSWFPAKRRTGGLGALLAVGLVIFPRAIYAQETGVILSPFTGAPPLVDAGELLLDELNCTACHAADDATKARLAPRQAPRLDAVGVALTPQFLRAWITQPHETKPGTPMPDLLHDLPAAEKAETVDALVHFLLSRQSPKRAPVAADSFQVQTGRLLYHTVGCVACHAPAENAIFTKATPGEDAAALPATDLTAVQRASVPLGPLARKTTVPELAKFLKDPLASRPSGRMPSLNLTDGEAAAIAMYLLRDQIAHDDPARPRVRTRGLSYRYFEGGFHDTRDMEKAQPKASGLVERFTLPPSKRANNIGFQFSGFVAVPADGQYTFYTASDDGSRLYLGPTLVVDNDGEHGNTEASGKIQLTKGEHPILVTYANLGAGAELKVSWEGPGFGKRQIPPNALSTDQGQPMVPLGEEISGLIPPAEVLVKVARGEKLFASVGCAACHESALTRNPDRPAPTLPAPKLANLKEGGCLDPAPRARLPIFSLTADQRTALQRTLARVASLSLPLEPAAHAARTMAALNCLACHQRDGFGGPAPGRSDYFTVVGGEDLGEEGRIPPHLTKVGDKLRSAWLNDVLVNRATARPYMAVRMPQFGAANVSLLAKSLVQADDNRRGDGPLHADDAKWGRKLVGTGGMSCIQCHTFAGRKSLGIPAMDLTRMAARLKQDWFHRYLIDPPSLRPGTRMPTFWPEGKSARADILEGDTERQIQALWVYLSLGSDAGLPPGLIQGKAEVVTDSEAVIYRNFLKDGAGRSLPRGIGVGYPEKANLIWDANALRLAAVWQGPFLDAAVHLSGRGSGFASPLGYNVLNLPEGAPFAVLENADAPWPGASGHAAGYQMQGYRLDAKQRPTFQFTFGNVAVADEAVAVPADIDATFHRVLTLTSDAPPAGLWFRAWSGKTIEEQGRGVFLADGKVRLKFEESGAARPRVRQSGGKAELLVPVEFHGREARVVEDIVW
jgi:cytochrome c